jgi:hypothetical protein
MNTFDHMCGTIDPGSCIWWVLGFGVKTEYDRSDVRGPSGGERGVQAVAKLLPCKRERWWRCGSPHWGCTCGELMLRMPSMRWLALSLWGWLRPMRAYISVWWPRGYALCPYASTAAAMRWPCGETSSIERLQCRSSRSGWACLAMAVLDLVG